MRRQGLILLTMKMTLLAAIALVTSLSQALATSLPPPGVTLSLDPVSQAIAVGAVGQINVNIQGLGRPPSLGAFDLTVSDSLGTLFFSDVAFGTHLGDPALSQALVSSSAPVTGTVHLKEVSLLAAATLDATEPAAFTLATIFFSADAPGLTSIGIGNITLSDGFGASLATAGVTGASVMVLPEPSCGLLVAAGLGSLGLVARRQRQIE